MFYQAPARRQLITPDPIHGERGSPKVLAPIKPAVKLPIPAMSRDPNRVCGSRGPWTPKWPTQCRARSVAPGDSKVPDVLIGINPENCGGNWDGCLQSDIAERTQNQKIAQYWHSGFHAIGGYSGRRQSDLYDRALSDVRERGAIRTNSIVLAQETRSCRYIGWFESWSRLANCRNITRSQGSK